MSEQENTTSRSVALITGGTRGIGLACAQALLAEGWDLALNGLRSEEEVEGVLEKLRAGGGETIYCRGDVSLASAASRFDRAIAIARATCSSSFACRRSRRLARVRRSNDVGKRRLRASFSADMGSGGTF